MKILFVNQYYWPDLAATAQQLSDLAEYLAERGHEVHVVCSRGRYDDGTSRRTEARQTHRGVHIRRLSAPGFGKRGLLGRLVDYAGFHLMCGAWMLWHGRKYDVIVTLTTPPLIGIYATAVRALRRGRTWHVCWVMDLHPDCEFELGMVSRRNPLARLADWLNGQHFRGADAVVALSPGMRDRIAGKGVSASKLRVISVWAADDGAPDERRVAQLRSEHGLDGRFVVMYSGNAGVMHAFESVCEAMRRLADDGRVRFMFAGGGKRRGEVQAYAADHGLGNVLFLPYAPREELVEWLALADVHLVTLRAAGAGVVLPSKTYGAMAAGRPVLFVGPADCDTARQVRDSGGGIAVETDDVAALVEAITALAADPAARERMGAAGRDYAATEHERTVCGDRWAALIESLGDGVRREDSRSEGGAGDSSSV